MGYGRVFGALKKERLVLCYITGCKNANTHLFHFRCKMSDIGTQLHAEGKKDTVDGINVNDQE